MYKKRKKSKIAIFFLVFATIKIFAQTTPLDAESLKALVSADTFYVWGSHSYGILNLSPPPNDIPYIIDEKIEGDNKKIILINGAHNIYWDGGIEYESIDTVVEVKQGEITNVVFNFVERKASLFIETEPEEAKIYLDSKLAGVGAFFSEIRAGEHKISVSAKGFQPSNETVTILPNRLVRFNIKLQESPDRDGDGFLDSIDICPDIYGIYDGCPKPKPGNEIKKLAVFWRGYLKSQPFTIEALAIAFQYRIATDPDFRELIHLFNDGMAIGANHRGVSVFNKLWISKSFWIVSAEYGQGFGGSKYKKSFDIEVDDYHLIYSRFAEKNPEIIINSYSGQFGFRAGNKTLTLAILTGYQKEKITLNNITKETEEKKKYQTSIAERNNSWITSVRAMISPKGEIFYPAFFAELSMTPISGSNVSGWISVRSGVLVPWRVEKKN
jgi:hypothetical protein